MKQNNIKKLREKVYNLLNMLDNNLKAINPIMYHDPEIRMLKFKRSSIMGNAVPIDEVLNEINDLANQCKYQMTGELYTEITNQLDKINEYVKEQIELLEYSYVDTAQDFDEYTDFGEIRTTFESYTYKLRKDVVKAEVTKSLVDAIKAIDINGFNIKEQFGEAILKAKNVAKGLQYNLKNESVDEELFTINDKEFYYIIEEVLGLHVKTPEQETQLRQYTKELYNDNTFDINNFEAAYNSLLDKFLDAIYDIVLSIKEFFSKAFSNKTEEVQKADNQVEQNQESKEPQRDYKALVKILQKNVKHFERTNNMVGKHAEKVSMEEKSTDISINK